MVKGDCENHSADRMTEKGERRDESYFAGGQQIPGQKETSSSVIEACAGTNNEEQLNPYQNAGHPALGVHTRSTDCAVSVALHCEVVTCEAC